MKWMLLAGLLIACADQGDDDDDRDGGGLGGIGGPSTTAAGGNTGGGNTGGGSTNPNGDDDGDGYSNSEEAAAGSNPADSADVPYAGGWVKDAACRDSIIATGNDEGEIAEDFALIDQYGDEVHLHDFCGRVVLLEFAGFS